MDLTAYLEPGLSADTQDIHLVRSAILRALRSQLHLFHGDFLDIGCGFQPYRSILEAPPSRIQRYIGMDLENQYGRVAPDVVWNGREMPLADASMDSAMATEVLEHCAEPLVVLREAHRILRPGGAFFFTVPFLWPLHDVPYDEHRYTPFAMERLLKEAGFSGITVKPMGGWDASLAQMLGLWALRRPMQAWKRRIMKRLTLPVVRYLVRHDHVPDPTSSPMITGLWGTAEKPR